MLPGSCAINPPTPHPLNTCPLNMTVAQLSLPFFKTKTMFPGMTCSSSGVSGTNPNNTRWALPSRALRDGGGEKRRDRHKIRDPIHHLAWTTSAPLMLWVSNYGPGAGSLTPISNCPGDREQGVARLMAERTLHVNVLRNHTCSGTRAKKKKPNITQHLMTPCNPCPPFPSEEEGSQLCLASGRVWAGPDQMPGCKGASR